VVGDPDDPGRTAFTCSKGRAGPDFHHAADRLDVPAIRRDGVLTPVTWAEALDDIAALTRGIVAEHGPLAVAHYVGTGGPLDPAGYAMGHGFFRALGTDQHYSALSIDCSGKALVPQLVSGVQLMFQPDLERASLLLAIGVNTVLSTATAACSTRSSSCGSCGPRQGRGGRSPPDGDGPARRPPPAGAAGQRSGSARLAVGRVLVERPDAAYLEACVDAGSLERLRRAVAPFDRDRTAAICGVPVETLDAAAIVVEAGRVAIETGTGTTMNRSANLTEWLV
jgi:anaerobic selenocysteine-containing dehydrogenase